MLEVLKNDENCHRSHMVDFVQEIVKNQKLEKIKKLAKNVKNFVHLREHFTDEIQVQLLTKKVCVSLRLHG